MEAHLEVFRLNGFDLKRHEAFGAVGGVVAVAGGLKRCTRASLASKQKLCKAGAVYLGYRAWQGWRSRIRRRGGPWRELERGVEPGSPRSEEALGICAPIQDDVESSE